jgi:hypothetical protein
MGWRPAHSLRELAVPRLDARTVWTDFVTKNAVPGAALHIRYNDETPPEVVEKTRQPSIATARAEVYNRI